LTLRDASFCVEADGEGVKWWWLPPNDMNRVIFVINAGEGAWDVPEGFLTRFDMSQVTSGEDG
jgi:hypothetical protein